MALMLHRYRLSLINQQYDVQKRLTEINMKIIDLQQYAGNIADGAVSLSDMMNTPPSLFNRTLAYMSYSHNGSIMAANQNMQQIMMLPNVQAQMAQMTDPNQQSIYKQWIFKNLYEQEKQKFAKREGALLNAQEKAMQKEKQSLELQLKSIQANLDGLKQAEKDDANNWKIEV